MSALASTAYTRDREIPSRSDSSWAGIPLPRLPDRGTPDADQVRQQAALNQVNGTQCGPRHADGIGDVGHDAVESLGAVPRSARGDDEEEAYRSDWQRFAGRAGHRRFPPLPAPPAVLAHYGTEAAAEQTRVGTWRYAPATLTRWVASINQVHTAAGPDPPGRNEIVRRALSGIRRIRATPPNRRAPLLLADTRTLMISIAETAPAGVGARRDMALLQMGSAGAHRRSELVALTLADVTLHSTDGLHVRLRRSKTVELDRRRGPAAARPRRGAIATVDGRCRQG